MNAVGYQVPAEQRPSRLLRVTWAALAPAQGRSLLSPAERARAQTYQRESARRVFCASRNLLRRWLGVCMGVTPARLEFAVGMYGKPFLVGRQGAFNQSHTPAFWAAAFHPNRTRQIGIDIEHAGRFGRQPADMAEAILSAAEQTTLAAHDPALHPRLLARAWVRKEAFLKALGTGMVHPMRNVDVGWGEGVTRFVWQTAYGNPSYWLIEEMDGLPGDLVGALALSEPFPALEDSAHLG